MLQNPDVQKVMALIKAEAAIYPEGTSIFEWAMLKNADPAAASSIANTLRTRPREVVEQSITNLLSPTSAADALETYWLDQLLGKPDEGKAAIKKVVDLGIPMPIGL